MQVFRQRKRGDWNDVFGRMAEKLRERVAEWSAARPLCVEVGAGELVDKITILQIKQQRLSDPAKRQHVAIELDALLAACAGMESRFRALPGLKVQLQEINATLWDIEDQIRERERAGDFGNEFISLARLVYKTNDRRAEVKRQINDVAGSRIVEEKGYHCRCS